MRKGSDGFVSPDSRGALDAIVVGGRAMRREGPDRAASTSWILSREFCEPAEENSDNAASRGNGREVAGS